MAAVAGVIAEYNPFHLGHAYQLSAIREKLGEDTAIVAVMSGNFVQRGECAIMEKHARAEAAVLGGADLVLELPTVYA
ncbi:MAG: nucleotidyltransferase family protein, partial [Clostridia bacterium]|nr:nucleotidyltransferase family protein [Clostridia bacterium]